MRKAIVVIADKNILPAACCVHLSALECGKLDEETTLFIITDSVSRGELHKAKLFFGQSALHVRILAAQQGLSEKYNAYKHLTGASYIRLHLDEYLGQEWDRVLYLDADARVMASLRPLLSANLQGQPLMAAHDFFGLYRQEQLEDCRSRLSLRQNAPYFNSGVLLFDWPKVLAGDYLTRARQYAQDHRDFGFWRSRRLKCHFRRALDSIRAFMELQSAMAPRSRHAVHRPFFWRGKTLARGGPQATKEPFLAKS